MPTTRRAPVARRALASPVPQPMSTTTTPPANSVANRSVATRYPAAWAATSDGGVLPSMGRSPVSLIAVAGGAVPRAGPSPTGPERATFLVAGGALHADDGPL